MNRSIPTTFLAAAAATLIVAACGHTPFSSGAKTGADGSYTAVTPLPVRDESVSFHGPGSAKVAKDKFPAIRFANDSYQLPEDAIDTLDSVATHLESSGASAILAGFTDDDEENRVLGERRALAVRQALIERGADPARLQTVSYGHDLPPSTGTADRLVEFGIVPGLGQSATPPVADAR